MEVDSQTSGEKMNLNIVETVPIVPILRPAIRVGAVGDASYIQPEKALFLNGVQEIGSLDTVITAICWAFKERPLSIPVKQLTLMQHESTRLHIVEGNVKIDQLLVFYAMSGIMTLAKEIATVAPRDNVEYLRSRWKAVCATLGIQDIFAVEGTIPVDTYNKIRGDIIKWQFWAKSQTTLRHTLLHTVLKERADEGIISAIIDQIKLVLGGYGLKSVQLMEAFITSGSKAILLKPIVEQAVLLKKAILELQDKYGDHYKYIRVYPLPGVDKLYHRHYPDLYYAAVTTALRGKKLGQEERYVMSDVTTVLSKQVIQEYAEKRLRLPFIVNENVKDSLRLLDVNVGPLIAALEEDEKEEKPRRKIKVIMKE